MSHRLVIAVERVGEIKHLRLREILSYILMSELKFKLISESLVFKCDTTSISILYRGFF